MVLAVLFPKDSVIGAYAFTLGLYVYWWGCKKQQMKVLVEKQSVCA